MRARSFTQLFGASRLGNNYSGIFLVFTWIAPLCTFAVENEQEKVGRYLGAASCAASTCHGGVLDRGPAWKSSWTQWSASDPHVNAGLSLQSRLSRKIVISLLGKPEDQVKQQDLDLLMRARCISCHVTTTPQQCSSTEPLVTAFLVDGVSCESCHGASSGWLKAHCSDSFPEDTRIASGFRETKDIQLQAQGCVRCHIGSRNADGLVRDMNHDMIAAGHPVLRFDLESYRSALPPHWQAAPAPLQTPVRDRLIGRSVALSAAAALASERARAFVNAKAAPFPEFADYDCFGCHQALSLDDYTIASGERRGFQRASDGLPIWNPWYADNLLQVKSEDWRMLPAKVQNAERISEAASQLAVLYMDKATDLRDQHFDAEQVLANARERCKTQLDWHEAAVLFLDVDAALRALALRNPFINTIRENLITKVAVFLRFRAGLQSPDIFDRDTEQRFRKNLSEVLQRVADRETQPSDIDVISEKN